MTAQLVLPKSENFSLETTSDLRELSVVRRFLCHVHSKLPEFGYRLAEEGLQSLILGTTEAVTNVIRHGYDHEADNPIQIIAAVENGDLRISIYHRGKAYSPQAVVLPELIEPSEGGMGLYIISRCVDDVTYEENTDGYQSIHLRKILTKGNAMDNTIELVGNIAVFQANFEALDAGSVNDFKQDLAPVLKEGALLILDLSQVEYVDSAGLGGIVSTLKQLRAEGGDVKICGLQKSVRALFELVRMHKLLDVCNTREEALKSFEQ
ncbi:MAG: anti-sigma B factor antagonist [Pirellulaceae bacterium]|jgi:anti-sigma B factor antagonist